MGFGAKKSPKLPTDSRLLIPKIRDEKKIPVVDGQSEVNHGHCPINVATKASIFVFLSGVEKVNHT
jgi:hypothetical protein